MRRSVALLLTAALALLAAPAGGTARDADAQLTVCCTTPAGGGVFFPGAGISDGTEITYPAPLQVTKGSNVVVTNFDEQIVANNHQIRSIKTNKRTKKALFQTKPLRHPGDRVTMITSHLKPGVYAYRCTTHSNMYGAIEIVR